MSSPNPPTPRATPLALLSCAGLSALLAVASCEPRKAAPPAEPPAAAPAAETAPAPAPTDPQIAHVAVTANSIDSSMGELAKTRTKAASVRDFAQMMVRDHGAVNKKAVQLATRLKVTPEANDISSQLQQDADQARTELEGQSGAGFDQAYMAREVQYHQAVLDALDQTLIPGAQNAELKTLLEQVRPSMAAHLEHARQVQAKLAK